MNGKSYPFAICQRLRGHCQTKFSWQSFPVPFWGFQGAKTTFVQLRPDKHRRRRWLNNKKILTYDFSLTMPLELHQRFNSLQRLRTSGGHSTHWRWWSRRCREYHFCVLCSLRRRDCLDRDLCLGWLSCSWSFDPHNLFWRIPMFCPHYMAQRCIQSRRWDGGRFGLCRDHFSEADSGSK